MNLLSALGKLPESNSPGWKLDNLDYQKIFRLAIVTFVGAFSAFVVQTPGLPEAASTWDQLGQYGLAAAQAGATAIGAAAMEAIRRFFTNQA